MKTILLKAIGTVLLFIAPYAFAGVQEEFCAGFSEGYKTVKGNMVLLPLCPLAPLTPLGSTPFREGLKIGIKSAQGS
jgi:hypothetical protein